MIDINKKYQTTDGHPVTLISDKGRSGHRFLGYVKNSRSLQMWDDEGKNLHYKPYNLVEVLSVDYTYFPVIDSHMVPVSGRSSINRILSDFPQYDAVLRVNTLAPYDTILIKKGDPLWPL